MSLKHLLVAAVVAITVTSSPIPETSTSRISKRSYYPWKPASNLPPYENPWKPAAYQLTRPYFIPVFGTAGRTPIYYPPQPLLNPGTPKDNPVRYQGPRYLPPSPPKTNNQPDDGMQIVEKFLVDEDDDDAPIWLEAPLPGNPLKAESSGTKPTRFPKTETSTLPPLVHSVVQQSTNQLSADDGPVQPMVVQAFPSKPDSQSFAIPNEADKTTNEVDKFEKPSSTEAPSGPSNCVWAIISCCSASTDVVPQACFEQRGCPGPFWDNSPCDTEYAKLAVESALKYFNPKR